MENDTFFSVFADALHQEYKVHGLPPFIGEFSDVSELPPNRCAVPIYFWQKPNHDIIFSCNKPLMENFAIDLAIQKQFVDVTIGEILQAVDTLCEVHKAAFMNTIKTLFNNV